MEESDYYRDQAKFDFLVERISSRVRGKIFQSFMELVSPGPATTVLDVGVTSNRRRDSNFFEAHYPYADKITAVGLEDATFLEEMYPGLRFVKADAQELPFEDNAFDVAVSWAVIEHVGSRENQRRFLAELARVSRSIFVTTPNRWYPVEFHTVMPLMHWLPPAVFRSLLTRLGKPYYAREENLNLLDEKSLFQLLPPELKGRTANARLLGPVSNLVLYASKGPA